MTDSSLEDFADRYVALWNEPDADRRRALVAELFLHEGRQILEPPQEIVHRAEQLGFVRQVLEARGHRALLQRVTRSFDEFVAAGGFRFRRAGEARSVGPHVRFAWEMVGADGAVAGVGTEVVELAEDGRIRLDVQFIEPG